MSIGVRPLRFALTASAAVLFFQARALDQIVSSPAVSGSAAVPGASWISVRGGNDGELPRPAGASFRSEPLSSEILEIEYRFRNFNEDPLKIGFTVVQAELDGALKEFGYTKKELQDIHKVFASKGDAAYRGKVRDYFASRGFRVETKDTVTVDIPLMVKRNRRRVNGAALALQRASEALGYESDDIIGAATAMVQTALAYRQPPSVQGARHTGGVNPPPKALSDGWGDCDTKSALLGALLRNWDGIQGVGVALPGHYLMGLERIPRQGDYFVERDGRQYVLIEPAGPAWLPPGTITADTEAMLERAGGVPIEPFL